MILDYASSPESFFEADICIVGTGVAAYTMLSSLVHTNLKIIVVERGGIQPDPDESLDKECLINGHVFTGHQDGRRFGLGGTSLSWGGQALPLHDFDFDQKEWVKYSGWPISPADITPFIPAAEAIMQVDPVPYDTDVFSLRSLASLHSDSGQVQFHFSKWSPAPNFKPGWLKKYASHPQIQVITHARALSLHFDEETKSVSKLYILNPEGKQGVISAAQYVLAAGGLENPCLLLASPTMPVNPWIGKMFQDHPTAQVATVKPKDLHRLQRYFGYFFLGKTRMLPRISLTQSAVLHHKILSATAFIQFIPPGGSFFENLKETYRSISRGHVPTARTMMKTLASMRHIGSLFAVAKAYVADRYAFVPGGVPRLTMMIEQSPDPQSQIVLSTTKDKAGQPIPEIYWHFGEDTIRTFKTYCSILESEFDRLDIGKIEWDSWVHQDDETIRQHLQDAYHHMGTTRMSATHDTGVVNTDCRMHDVQNVYIAGSSVFPTSGHSNPTLTFMALALRLSQNLIQNKQ